MTLHKPTLADIPEMQALVRPYIDEGTILERSSDEMATTIRSYTLAKEGPTLVGFVALHVHSPELAEVRSLVVAKTYQGKGIGKALVLGAVEEGKKLGLSRILTLTFQKAFFEKLGFEEVNKEDIPEHKVWQDCIRCKLFPVCNESALIITL